MPFEPNDELTFTLTAAETQHLINTIQQTYQTSLQIVMKITTQAQTQVQGQSNVAPLRGNGPDVSDTMPTAE